MAANPLGTPGIAAPPVLTLLQGGLGGELTAAMEAAGAGGAATLIPGAAIILGGAYIETKLLQNKQWDDMWLSAGAHIEGIWHGVYNFLNPPSKPSSADVKRMIDARAALTAEHARQVSTAHTAVELALASVMHAEHVARVGDRNVAGSRIRAAYTEAVKVANANYVKAVSHANALDKARAKVTLQQIAQNTTAERQHAVDTIQRPLSTQALKTQAQLENFQKSIGALIAASVAAETAARITPIMKTLANIQARLAPLEKEAENCVQPMCDVVGPKTDVGKLLKSVNVAKWLAAFAALETMDVKTLERIAGTIAAGEGALGDWVANRILDELEAEHP